jgi:hypothetical protein
MGRVIDIICYLPSIEGLKNHHTLMHTKFYELIV